MLLSLRGLIKMNYIKIFRNKRKPKITQEELGKQIGFKKNRIANYEKFFRDPNSTDCRTIVKGLNDLNVHCTLDDIFPPHAANDESNSPDAA
jgi:DNA-binding XRE family transcriptional regulator